LSPAPLKTYGVAGSPVQCTSSKVVANETVSMSSAARETGTLMPMAKSGVPCFAVQRPTETDTDRKSVV